MQFQGQTALITGAGSGIGQAIARALSRDGAAVSICGRTPEKVEQAAREIRAAGGRAVAVAADVSRETDVAVLVRKTEDSLGPIDILVNNAGIARFGKVWEMSPDDFDVTMAVNVRGVFLCCRAVVPGMIERRKGRILNIASASGVRPYAEQGAYCASKHAVLGLTKVLALEVQPYGIGVQALSPGVVDTPLSRGIHGPGKSGAWMTPEEVAAGAVYLLSQRGVAMTDHLILRRQAATPWGNASG